MVHRPAPPPPLASRAYTVAFDEIAALGVAHGSTASADQVLTARFWNGAIQNYWNEIAQTAVLTLGLSTPDSARLFALLDLTFADAVIAFYDAKYTYVLWRPVTAVREAGSDGNRATAGDPGLRRRALRLRSDRRPAAGSPGREVRGRARPAPDLTSQRDHPPGRLTGQRGASSPHAPTRGRR